MEKLIYTNGQYNIWQLVGKENLNELAEFVVRRITNIMWVIFPPNLSRMRYILFIKKNSSILITPRYL